MGCTHTSKMEEAAKYPHLKVEIINASAEELPVSRPLRFSPSHLICYVRLS